MNTDRATTTGAGIQGGVRGDLQVMRAKMQRNTGALQLMAGQGSLEAALALKEIVDGNAYKESMLRTSAMQNPNTNSVVAQLGAKADNFQQGAQYPGTARYADGGLVRGYAGAQGSWVGEDDDPEDPEDRKARMRAAAKEAQGFYQSKRTPRVDSTEDPEAVADRARIKGLATGAPGMLASGLDALLTPAKEGWRLLDNTVGRGLRAAGVPIPRMAPRGAGAAPDAPSTPAAAPGIKNTAGYAQRQGAGSAPAAGLVAAAGAGAGGDTYAGVESSGPPKTSTAPSLGAGATPAAAAAVQSDANTLLSSLDKLRSREKELNEQQRVALQEKADAAIKRLSEATNTPWKKLVQWADNTLAARRANPTARGLAVAGLGAAASRGQDEARKGQIDTIQADLAEKNRLISMADIAAERGDLEGAYKLRAQADEVAQKRKKQEADIRYTDAHAAQADASAKKSVADASKADRYVQPVKSGRSPRSMAMTDAQREAAVQRESARLAKDPKNFDADPDAIRQQAIQNVRAGSGGGTAPAAPAALPAGMTFLGFK